LYEPQTRQGFVFNGHSGSGSVIDAADNKVVATIALGGAPEFARADGAGNVYVNIESKNELAALDANRQKVTARWRARFDELFGRTLPALGGGASYVGRRIGVRRRVLLAQPPRCAVRCVFKLRFFCDTRFKPK
jgi:YVTN family beta-propeller protein